MTDMNAWLKLTCARYGVSYMPEDSIDGKDRANYIRHVGARRADQDIDFIRVRSYGRMGNNLIQMAMALCFAERTRIPEVRHGFSFLEDTFLSEGGVRVIRSEAPDDDKAQGFEQIFFHPEYLTALKGTSAGEYCAQLTGPVAQAFRIKPAIRPERRVVAHLRGGDVFRPDIPGLPHPYFVQPPLSFYQLTIREALKDGALDMAHVIAEDLRNPVALPLVEWLSAQKIPFEFTSTDRDSDAALLMGSEALIMGYSSFSEIMALLSGVISSVTLFRTSQRTDWLRAKFPDLKIVDCRQPDYIAPDNWKCSPEQLDLLLAYPEEKLRFRSLN